MQPTSPSFAEKCVNKFNAQKTPNHHLSSNAAMHAQAKRKKDVINTPDAPSPEATPSDVMLAKILQLRRLHEQLVNLQNDI